MSKHKHVSETESKPVEAIVEEKKPVSRVLNEGQKLQVMGRVKSGMTHQEAVDFVLAKVPRVGRSEKALALRAKHPKKFAKLDATGNVNPPSEKKLAYLKAIKEKEEAANK